MRRAAFGFLIIIATGCPPKTTAPTTGGGSTAAVATTGIVREKRERPKTDEPAKPAEYKEDADFPRKKLAELYRAEQLAPDAEVKELLAKEKLVRGDGKPTDLAGAYERALKRWATERPLEWAALVQEIAEARAKARATSSVR